MRTGPGAVLGSFAGGADASGGVSTGRFPDGLSTCRVVCVVERARAALEDTGVVALVLGLDLRIEVGAVDGPGMSWLPLREADEALATETVGAAGVGFRDEVDPPSLDT